MTAVRISHFRDKSYRFLGGNLNVRQLLNPIFYSRDVQHTHSKRQRKACQKSRDRRAARSLKAQYVPLYFVDPTVYIHTWDRWGDGSPYGRYRVVRLDNAVTLGRRTA